MLGACAGTPPQEGISSFEIRPKSHFPGQVERAAAQAALEDRACYRTLGRVDCHARPLPREAFRKVGFYDWAALRGLAGY